MTICWVEPIVERWKAQGLHLGVGLEPRDVAARFAAAGRAVTTDVLALFESCNGMTDGAWDENAFTLWSLDRCLEECASHDALDVPFADFLISSAEYLFRRETGDRSTVWIGYGFGAVAQHQVASSVEEFFHLLMVDPKRLEL